MKLIYLEGYIHLIEPLGLVVHNNWEVGVVIPARNEEDYIGDVLSNIPHFVDNVVVVNDGSTDSTEEVANKFIDSKYNLTILQNNGKGVGSAIDRGHRQILEICKKPFVSVVMAGDGQMNPNDMENLILPIIAGHSDYCKGDRFIHPSGLGEMPTIRKYASLILAFFTSLASGLKISDPQCGYTATSFRVLETWDWKRSWKGYGYPNYWIINLTKRVWRISHVPVHSVYGSQGSAINNLSFFFKVGIMMAIQHHRRVFAKLFSRDINPHIIFAFISYFIGWVAIIPWISTDLERTLASRGVPIYLLVLIFWSAAHIFDKLSVKVSQELKNNASN